MTNPMNPVLKPGTLSLPAKGSGEPPKKKRAAPRTLARLSMPDNHKLIQWLLAHEMQPGETFVSLATLATRELGIEVNANHVQNRMHEFDLKTIPVAGDGARVAKLERAMRLLVSEYVTLARELGHDRTLPSELAEFFQP